METDDVREAANKHANSDESNTPTKKPRTGNTVDYTSPRSKTGGKKIKNNTVANHNLLTQQLSTTLTETIKSYEELQKKYETETKGYQTTIVDLNKTVQEKDTSILQLQQENTRLQTELSTDTSKQKLTAEIQRLKALITQKDTAISDLQQQNAALMITDTDEQNDVEINRLNLSIQQLQNSISEKNREIADINEQRTKQETAYQKLKGFLQEEQAKCRKNFDMLYNDYTAMYTAYKDFLTGIANIDVSHYTINTDDEMDHGEKNTILESEIKILDSINIKILEQKEKIQNYITTMKITHDETVVTTLQNSFAPLAIQPPDISALESYTDALTVTYTEEIKEAWKPIKVMLTKLHQYNDTNIQQIFQILQTALTTVEETINSTEKTAIKDTTDVVNTLHTKLTDYLQESLKTTKGISKFVQDKITAIKKQLADAPTFQARFRGRTR